MLFLAVEVKNHQNIGTHLRSAVAFGANAIIVIGSTKFGSHGAHGAQKHVPIIHFYTWDECKIFAELTECLFYGISSVASLGTSPEMVQFRENAIFIININGKLWKREADSAFS